MLYFAYLIFILVVTVCISTGTLVSLLSAIYYGRANNPYVLVYIASDSSKIYILINECHLDSVRRRVFIRCTLSPVYTETSITTWPSTLISRL